MARRGKIVDGYVTVVNQAWTALRDNQPLQQTGRASRSSSFESASGARPAAERWSVMSRAAIRLGDAIDFVEIRLLEIGDRNTPAAGDVRLGISVAMGSFGGTYDQVWIAADEWRTFLAALSQLERERFGQAGVESMSPGEFALRLQIVNAAGELSASGWLSRYHFGHPSGQTSRSCIEYHFALDPSMLRLWVEAFASLGSPDV